MGSRPLTPEEKLLLIEWVDEQSLKDAKVVENAAWLKIFNRFGGGWGFTFGNTIYLNTDPSLAVLGHELVHVRQYRELGKLPFIIKYLVELSRLNGKSIDNHPLEGPSYEVQWAIFKEYQYKTAANIVRELNR